MTEKLIVSAHSRLISEWEHKVDINLTESAVLPISVKELSNNINFHERLLEQHLSYPHTNGTPELRASIASIYTNSNPEQLVVTIGAAQANFTAAVTLLEPGDEITLFLPTYKQLGAVANKFGYRINTIYKQEELNWGIDIDEVKKQVSKNTKLIFICNPDNPTGHILSESEVDALIQIAEQTGAWLLVDEVCHGTERVIDQETASLWGKSDRIIITASLSKAYGLPGTRIGWVLAPEKIAQKIWATQDYLTISASMLGNKIAELALQPDIRTSLFRRSRTRIRSGYDHLRNWIGGHEDIFQIVDPQATPSAFVRYNRSINSTKLAHRLIEEKSTLIVPGDGFGIDNYFRISFDVDEQKIIKGLENIYDLLSRM